jgi:flagellar basal-body rod protein FlgC
VNLIKAMIISASGMKAQGTRLRVIAENLANANSMGKTAGGDPYRRKIVNFKSELDRKLGVATVAVTRVSVDPRDFPLRSDPGHPAANAEGYVKLPNVNPLLEMSDMREAQHSYEANLGVIEAAKGMLSRTVELLR